MKTRFGILLLCTMLTAMQILAQPRSISNVRVAPHDTIQSENAITIHPLDNNKLVTDWNDFGSGVYAKQKFAYSSLAGAMFIEGNAMTSLPSPYQNYIYSFDPSVCYDRNGIVYAAYISTNQAGVLGFTTVAKSTNNGYDWSKVKVSTADNGQDKPWLTIDNTTGTYSGRLYISWSDFTNGIKIQTSYSGNGGTSFSSPVVLQSKTPTTNKYGYSIEAGEDANSDDYLQGSMPAVGPNGEVYVVWADINGWNDYNSCVIKLAKSTNGGQSYPDIYTGPNYTHRKADVSFWKLPSFPSIAIDQNDGTIYIAYVDVVSSSDFTQRIKFIFSNDGGETFSEPSILPTVGTGYHLMPTVSVDANGIVSVAFVYVPSATANGTVDVYYTQSEYQGYYFTTPVRVSNQSSTINSDYYTDYMQMVSSSDGHRYIAWTDNRSHKPNTYVGDVNFGPVAPANVAVAGVGKVSPKAKVTWSSNTESEMQQSGAQYEIYRGTSSETPTLIATVPYTATSYTDNDVIVGSGGLTIYYRVRAKGSNNYHSPYSGSVSIGSSNWQQDEKIAIQQVPIEYGLDNNYPNPFNPSTTISYQIPSDEIVSVKVFDALGREIKTLVDEFRTAGFYSIHFDASRFASGVYYYKINAGSFTSIKRMILTK